MLFWKFICQNRRKEHILFKSLLVWFITCQVGDTWYVGLRVAIYTLALGSANDQVDLYHSPLRREGLQLSVTVATASLVNVNQQLKFWEAGIQVQGVISGMHLHFSRTTSECSLTCALTWENTSALDRASSVPIHSTPSHSLLVLGPSWWLP